MPLPLWPRIMARASQNPGLMQRDSTYLLYIILDELLEYYETLEEELQGEIEIKEERALTNTPTTSWKTYSTSSGTPSP
jgi:hypothetical protein